MIRILLIVAVILAIIKYGSSRSEIRLVSKMKLEGSLVDKYLSLLKEIGISNEEVVLAQAILETGNFKSKICRQNNNHYGMKWNERGYAKGVRYGHSYYDCALDSYLDYKEWQSGKDGTGGMLCGRTLTDEQYLSELNRMKCRWNKRYAEDPLYTDKLRILIKKIRACKTVSTGVHPDSLGEE